MSIQVSRLLNNSGTLYGMNPSRIAARIENKLNELLQQGREVLSISAIPDFHNWADDGGVKDVFFLTQPATSSTRRRWHVWQIIEDYETMHGIQSEPMMDLVQNKVDELSRSNIEVRHIIPLTDHHAMSVAQGVGGLDGVKNILLCYLA